MLTLAQVKQRLRIDAADSDADLELLIEAAYCAFEETTNRKLFNADESIPDTVLNGINVNPFIIQGMLSLIGYWYENPETNANSQDLPQSTLWAWNRYRFMNMG